MGSEPLDSDLLPQAVMPLPLPPQPAETITVCSFNIQFVGHFKDKNNSALAAILKDFDVVVVQELVAPPLAGTFPDGDAYKPDAEAKAFFDEMVAHGFQFKLSEEDTGTGDAIHNNGPATEWWVVFYKLDRVMMVTDWPNGFLADDRSNHPDYERVPYAFAFRTLDATMDMVLISVHLQPGSGSASRLRRKHELTAISNWIAAQPGTEKDYIILGDMNIEDRFELAALMPPGFVSLNDQCEPERAEAI